MDPKAPSESRRWIGQDLVKMEMIATVHSSDHRAAAAASKGRQLGVRMKLVATDNKVTGTATSGGAIAQVIHVPLQVRGPHHSPPSTPPDRRAPLIQMVGKLAPEMHPHGIPRETDSALMIDDQGDPLPLAGSAAAPGDGEHSLQLRQDQHQEEEEFEVGFGPSWEVKQATRKTKRLFKSAVRTIIASQREQAPAALVGKQAAPPSGGCCGALREALGLGKHEIYAEEAGVAGP
jgi:hypothetical protein